MFVVRCVCVFVVCRVLCVACCFMFVVWLSLFLDCFGLLVVMGCVSFVVCSPLVVAMRCCVFVVWCLRFIDCSVVFVDCFQLRVSLKACRLLFVG